MLLIEPEAAKLYEANLPEALKPEFGLVGGITPTSGKSGGFTTSKPFTVGTGAVVGTVQAKAKSFHGSAEVNPATAKMRLVELADEIISILASDPQAELKITVEINADFPTGASDQIKRAVSENAKSLGFKSGTWE